MTKHRIRLSILPIVALVGCGEPSRPSPKQRPTPAASPMGATDAPPAPSTPAPPTGVSAYTSIADCRLIDSAPDEAGYYLRRCPGKAGYDLDVTEADGRFNITLVSRTGRWPLEMPGIIGTGFSELGSTAEWRAPSASGRPTALIVRYAVVEQADRPDRPTAYLVVIDLARRCIIAKTPPGGGQNAAARRIADEGAACLPTPGGDATGA